MLENLSMPHYGLESEDVTTCRMQTISREVASSNTGLTPQRLHASPLGAAAEREEVARAYLLGALGDATFNELHRTFRFAQKEREWLEMLQRLLVKLGSRSWIYREGRTRNLHVLETSARFLRSEKLEEFQRREEQIAYVRGYFDAEGGIPQDSDASLYIQFVQKNLASLTRVKNILEQIEVRCGAIHNPSRKVDPEYWRFFVRRGSHQHFIAEVGSWHPRKAKLLQQRVKI